MAPHFITTLPAGAYPGQPSHSVSHETLYHYYVSKSACIAFIVCFSLSTILHVAQAAIHRGTRWMLWTTVLCGVGEIIGWSGRLWSALDPAAGDAYLMQITTTIIAPTFLVAASFIILGRIVTLVGPHYSRLPPSMYCQIFLTVDLLALVIQTIGGVGASLAEGSAGRDQGAKVMLGGIGLQLSVMIIYAVLATEFLLRARLDRPLRKANPLCRYEVDHKIEMMIFGFGLGAIFLLTRAIYRTIELTGGWHDKIIAHQTLFNWLDGILMIVSMVALNLLHPGRLVYNTDRVEPEANQLSTKLSGLSPESPIVAPSKIYRSSGVPTHVSFPLGH